MVPDVFLNYHDEAGFYFAPKEAVFRKPTKDLPPGTENYAAILSIYKVGKPSFSFLHYDGKAHYVGYVTVANK